MVGCVGKWPFLCYRVGGGWNGGTQADGARGCDTNEGDEKGEINIITQKIKWGKTNGEMAMAAAIKFVARKELNYFSLIYLFIFCSCIFVCFFPQRSNVDVLLFFFFVTNLRSK